MAEGSCHPLDVAEAGPHTGTTKLDHETRLALTDSVGDIVGFYLGGTAAVDTRRLMRNLRIGKGPTDNARPSEFLGNDGVCGTDIRLGIKAETKNLGHLSDSSHHCWIEMLFGHAPITGVALHAFVRIDHRTPDHRVDVNSGHGTNRQAITAGNALVWVDFHLPCPSPPEPVSKRYVSAAAKPAPKGIGTPKLAKVISTPARAPSSSSSLRLPRWPMRKIFPLTSPSPGPKGSSRVL